MTKSLFNIIAPKNPQPALVKTNAPKVVPETLVLATTPIKEIGGQQGPEPTRYGDWEKAGRCTDF